ncbi:O-antigen ligase family protein [Lonepinella sp. BR2357]|uniref:O-antigen ligase family protein n=1 Tax=Lonepinella sp. BR2357 TaxID=3434549 RepID=UPI003F6DF6B8
MSLNKLIVPSWLCSIFTIFLPPIDDRFPIYVFFFSIFIYLSGLSILNRRFIPRISFIVVIVFSIFITLIIVSHLVNIDVSFGSYFVKFLVNILFLFSFVLYSYNNKKIIVSNVKWLRFTLELIIFLTFSQILLNVHLGNIWLIPVIGVQNSIDGYEIMKYPIYFGSLDKNTWATKFVFIVIVYLSFIYFKVFSVSKIKKYLMLGMATFCVIYMLSRTAQLSFILFIFLFYLWKILFVHKNKLLKVVTLTVLIITSVLASFILFDKLFHIKLDSADGLAARLYLWKAFYLHLEHMYIVIGNGIFSSGYILPLYERMDNALHWHNAFMTMFADVGFFGLIIFIWILKFIFWHGDLNRKYRLIFLCYFVPLFISLNSQYAGYDNDVVIYSSLVIFLYIFFIYDKKLK